MNYKTRSGGLDNRMMLNTRSIRAERGTPWLAPTGSGQDIPMIRGKVISLPPPKTSLPKQAGGAQPQAAGTPTQQPKAETEEDRMRKKITDMLLRDPQVYRAGEPDNKAIPAIIDAVLKRKGEIGKNGKWLGDIVAEEVYRRLHGIRR